MGTQNLRIIEQLAAMELAVSRLYRTYAEKFPEERSLWEGLAEEEEQHHQWANTLLESAKAGKVKVKEDAGVNAQMIVQAIKEVEGHAEEARNGSVSLRGALMTAYSLETSLVDGKAFSLLESPSYGRNLSVCEELASATSTHALRLKMRIEDEFGSLESAPPFFDVLAADREVKQEQVVAACGLLCSLCRKYKNEKCPGCAENEKASWCKVRTCCQANGYKTCAECEKFADPKECRDFENLIARAFGMLFNSDRAECIRQIKRIGLKEHAKKLTESGNMTIPRR